MASFRILYLAVKPLAQGGFGYYWQPSPALARKGWKPVNLGIAASPADPARMDAARARNAEVDAWRAGGATPRQVRRFVQAQSMAQLIERFLDHLEARVGQHGVDRRERNATIAPMSPRTRDEYRSKLRIVETWATDPKKPGGYGNLPVTTITPDRVTAFRDGLMRKRGGRIMWDRAHGALRVLSALFTWAEDVKLIPAGSNPARHFKLDRPPPRSQVWDRGGGTGDIDAICAAAERLGIPSIALAVRLGEFTGQRQADILKLNRAHWQKISFDDPVLIDQLRGDDPELKGFVLLTQNKTGAIVNLPVFGALRRAVEAAFAVNLARAPAQLSLLVSERTGRPWKRDDFIHKFAEVRAAAAAPPAEWIADGFVPRPGVAELQFRDLRRTRVVRLKEANVDRLGISTITGHALKSIDEMLKVYGPNTERQAAIVMLRAHGATPRESSKDERRA